MTGFGEGFSDAVRRFSRDVDAAVSRARRASSEARERAASFQRDNRNLAQRARSGEVRVRPEELTPDELRRAAAGFRSDRGLPVDEFPGVEELSVHERGPKPAPKPGRGARPAGPYDDEEDFSQARIMSAD